MKKFLSGIILILAAIHTLSVFAADDWKKELKAEFVNKHVELNPIPFSIPFKQIYPDFNRIKISITKENWTQDSSFSFVYNKDAPTEHYLYSQVGELIKFLLNRYNYKIISEGDIVKYIVPVISLTEIIKITDTEYHLLTGEAFFDSKSGYILKTIANGSVKSIEREMKLK